jgi:hypothetical protein
MRIQKDILKLTYLFALLFTQFSQSCTLNFVRFLLWACFIRGL